MRSQPPVAQVGRLRPQAVSRDWRELSLVESRENRVSSFSGRVDLDPSRLEPRGFRRSRVHRTFCFALQRDSLSFARPNERKQRKRRPDSAPARNAPTTAMLSAKGYGQNSDRFRDPQTDWPHRRSAPGTFSRCASRSLQTGPEYRQNSHKIEFLKPPRGHRSTPVRSDRFAHPRKPTYKNRDLERATATLACIRPLGRSAEQRRRQAEQGSRMFERSEFPAAPLSAFAERESMRSIGARQGVLCFGYFHLDKQMKVTRTAVRNPKRQSTRTVDTDKTRERDRARP